MGGAAPPPVSVIVPTRGERPDHLARCLAGLALQRRDDFEVIVAGPPGALAAPGPCAFAGRLLHVPFAEAHVGRARNAGIAAAAGDILAFLDDDAVPEPSWLDALLEGLALPGAGAAGGFVLGPDGRRWQWRAEAVDATGADIALDIPPLAPPCLPGVPAGTVAKAVGTNMAWRREVLAAIGGFSGLYRYFLDEADACLRAAAAGWRIALAPRAVVHHAFAGSALRDARAVPLGLAEIGASRAAFLARHAPPAARAAALAAFRDRERLRLLGLMQRGLLEPGRVRPLLASFDAGAAEGAARAEDPAPDLAPRAAPGPGPFPRRGPASGLRLALVDLPGERAGMAALADRAALLGAEATLVRPRFGAGHGRVRLLSRGVWLHEPGAGPLLPGRFRPGARAARARAARAEIARLAPLRAFTHVLAPDGAEAEAAPGVRRFGVYVAETLSCTCPDIAVIFRHPVPAEHDHPHPADPAGARGRSVVPRGAPEGGVG